MILTFYHYHLPQEYLIFILVPKNIILILPICMNVRTNNEDYIRRLRSKILRPAVEDSSTGRRIFDHNLRPNEDSSTAIFDPLFLEPSYRREHCILVTFLYRLEVFCFTALRYRWVKKIMTIFSSWAKTPICVGLHETSHKSTIGPEKKFIQFFGRLLPVLILYKQTLL